ncbi:hypothetical protein [Ehrlichia muris]|uniref:Uncharacterized protein n=1 Tax=Ehrlichia muris AS145 TaxID=1423892 RepID=V9R9Y8_9RICK|nr:hypothetical protein EMUR_01705 [Ehrlichia muris AS145]
MIYYGLLSFIENIMNFYCSDKNLIASSAAIHPELAATTACLYILSCTSPAAKIPQDN